MDVRVQRLWERPKIKDHTRIVADDYYFYADKADEAGRNRDLRRVHLQELARAIYDEVAYRNEDTGEYSGDLEARVTALELNDGIQDGRLDTLDAHIVRLDAEQGIQDSRLDDIEAEQVVQNGRIFQNEQDIALLQTAVKFLFDGTYAFGRRTSRLRWSPANSGSNPNTRISFDEVTLLSNVQHPDNFSFTPDYEADYFVNVNLRFAPDSSGDEWYIQPYVNGSGVGSPFYFKPDEVSGGEQVLMSTQFGFHMVPGDVLDIRLWPDDSGKAGWIEVFNYSMIGMGIEGIPVS